MSGACMLCIPMYPINTRIILYDIIIIKISGHFCDCFGTQQNKMYIKCVCVCSAFLSYFFNLVLGILEDNPDKDTIKTSSEVQLFCLFDENGIISGQLILSRMSM